MRHRNRLRILPGLRKFAEDVVSQRLPGTYPSPNTQTSISVTLFFGLLFVALAFVVHSANTQVVEIVLRYDNYTSKDVSIRFHVDRLIPLPIYFYYHLKDFPKNHRRMQHSVCWFQMTYGNSSMCDTAQNRYQMNRYFCKHAVVKKCPFWNLACNNNGLCNTYYAPMGAIAANMFNDTFEIFNQNGLKVPFTTDGIVTDGEKKVFVDLKTTKPLCQHHFFVNTAKPDSWEKHICEMGGYRNVDFIVWMRAVAHSSFNKIYRVLQSRGAFEKGLAPGYYVLKVKNNYPCRGTEKSFKILHPSWLGRRSDFFFYGFLLIGIVLVFTAILFLAWFSTFQLSSKFSQPTRTPN